MPFLLGTIFGIAVTIGLLLILNKHKKKLKVMINKLDKKLTKKKKKAKK